MGASIGAAMGLRSNEERAREAEYERLMRETAPLAELANRVPEDANRKIEVPGSRPDVAVKEPGEKTAPRADSGKHEPVSAPGSSRNQVIAEPDDEEQPELELSNPHGQHGKPDHQAAVKRLVRIAEREFPNGKIETGRSIFKVSGVNRRPDVWVWNEETGKILKVYEAARFNPDGSLPERERLKKLEYDQAGIPSHFEPVVP